MKDKSIIDKLGITPGPWESRELSNGKNIIVHDKTCSLLTVHMEYDPCDEEEKPWGVFYNKKDSDLSASAPEMLEALIDRALYLSDIGDDYMNAKEVREFGKILIIIKKATGKSWEEIKELL